MTVAAIHLTAGSALLAAAPAPAAFVAPATTLHIDASRVFLGAPQTTLGAVTLANGGTLGFAPPDGAAFRKATLAGIAGGGVLLINTHLGAGHADQLTIHGAITGDYRLVISNTGSIKGFTSPVTIIAADDARNATFTPLWQNTGMYHYTLDTRADGPLTLMQITGVGALSMAGQIINATAGALPLGWLSELTSVSQRLGELRLDAARRPRLNSWLRGYGRQHRFNGKVTRFNGHDGEPFD
ncbi:MAG: autotransporter outer membrane beta-barrel domain-containing protein, partial [Opitutaceae bacterium]|nr:autotransporter outer membrane beta-barrel domain-containing protein [Opitutaceae bacterium]